MNRIHRSVWCPRRGTHIAVAETSPLRSKASSASGVAGALLASALLGGALPAFAAGTAPSPDTLPSGAQVQAGAAQISQSGRAMTITQGSARTAIDWQSFSIGSNALVNFVQPSAQAVALNRVLGADVSVIQGSINANGQVFLVNPNGVLFTPTAQVNVGALVASTHNISTPEFMAGQYRFAGSSTAAVENQGQITAATGGAVALIAARVVNTGNITATGGRIGLAAANTVTLDLGGPVLLNVSEGALNAEIAQGGALRADGGQIFLTARAANNLAAAVINHSGVTEAKTLADVTGSIALNGDIVSHTGTLDASGAATGQRGGQISLNAALIIDAGITRADGQAQGGRIEQRATQIEQTTSAHLSANSTQGQGGSVRLLGDSAQGGSAWLSGTVTATGVQGGQVDATAYHLVTAGLQVDTSGSQNAGQVRLGGGWQGHDADLVNATTTTLGTGSVITNEGTGGRVVVWSDQDTRYGGHIQAAGSATEVSGKEHLVFAGTAQTASLLLDPKNITIEPVSSGLNALTIANPNGVTGDGFGTSVLQLSNGNLVVTAPTSDVAGVVDAGRVYLYSSTGSLISTLSGSGASDKIGNGTTLPALASGNYLILSPNWNGNAGAVTWGSGSNGVSGVLGAANSLVGSTTGTSGLSGTGDQVGYTGSSSGVFLLSNGNYLVRSPLWNYSTTATKAGAVTWGSGSAGVSGVLGDTNSLVGNTQNDKVGLSSSNITELSNGNYLVNTKTWNTNTGAVTWGDGTLGIAGIISASNSLVGSTSGSTTTGDQVGSSGITLLRNGNYLVRSQLWDYSPSATNAGAITWGNASTGVRGVVSAANSLVGSSANDSIGSSTYEIATLSNGNYVVRSPSWDASATLTNAGAVTWGNGSTGVSGVISAANSLVGSAASDGVGSNPTVVLTNNNYVVNAPLWNSGATVDVGAVVWGSGTTGVAGAISSANALVGSTASDKIGYNGVTALTNGNYVVASQNWKNGTVTGAGAVTWGNGSSGTTGLVSASNSLVGTTANDHVGGGYGTNPAITALTNGHYVVSSYQWNGLSGAVTWGNGNGGTVGGVSAANSLIGGAAGDQVGASGITLLNNGNYLVRSEYWSNGGVSRAGAITWGNASAGTVGVVSASNSLVGSSAYDSVGYGSIYELGNGNYVVVSPAWNGGGSSLPGAVTWSNGNGSTVGPVSSANSLIGSSPSDGIGGAITVLQNGNYLVRSQSWNGGMGAVTWGSGTSGISGVISSSNSLVGSTIGDYVGNQEVIQLSNGNYLVRSPNWNSSAGAVTWASGTSGIVGVISSANSLVGSASTDAIGGTITVLGNDHYVVNSPNWNSNSGAVTWGNGTVGISGAINASNSLVGTTSGDMVGSAGIIALSNSNYVVQSPYWSNGGAASGAGAVTWVNGATGLTGAVTATNSLVGSAPNDGVGLTGVTALNNGNYVVRSANWSNGTIANAGAVTWGNGSTGTVGTINGMNSVVGTQTNQKTGFYGLLTMSNGAVLIRDISSADGGQLKIIDGTASLGSSDAVSSAAFSNNPSASSTLTPTDLLTLLDAGTAVTLQANNDITLASALAVNNVSGNGGALTLQAGRNINLNAQLVTDNGNFTAVAGSINAVSAQRDAGNPTITLGSGASIDAGTGTVNLVTQSANGRFVNNASLAGSAITANTTNLYLPSWNTGATTYATLGGLSGTDKRYNTSWNEGSASGTCATAGCTLPGTGLNFLYAAAPVLSVAPATGQTSTYGNAFTASGYTLSGWVDGDTAGSSGVSGTALYSVGGSVSASGKLSVGAHNITYSSGLLSSLGYSFADLGVQTSELMVAQASIGAVTGITAANKTYDGTTTATLNTANAGFTGMVSGDALTVATSMGAFANKNAGTGKTVNITGLTLGGTDAANYTLASSTASTSADVAQASISAVTGITAANKTYDGTTTATLNTANAGFTGMVSGDALTVAASQGAFSDASPGAAKSVHISGLALGGADSANYTLVSNTSSAIADISEAVRSTTPALGGAITSASVAVVGLGQALAVGTSVASMAPLATTLNTPDGSETVGPSSANSSVTVEKTDQVNSKSSDEDKAKASTQPSAPVSGTAATPTLQSGGVRFIAGPAGAGRDAAGFIQVGVIRGGILLPTTSGR